uniref:Uncharacterized protein n=1 Tax=Aegilops tauschii subsp. strangulata TaxID=200361 RepID=A0A453RK96_AEGTS
CRSPERRRRRRWYLDRSWLLGMQWRMRRRAFWAGAATLCPIRPLARPIRPSDRSRRACVSWIKGWAWLMASFPGRPATPSALEAVRRVGRPQWRGGFVHDIQFWGRGDESPAVVSSCTMQSLRHSGPALANTTIRVGWKRRYMLIVLSPWANL